MYRQYQNSVKEVAPSSPPAAKCAHPTDGVRFLMVRDGNYDHGQYDYSFAVECQACKSIFATGQSDIGGIFLRLIKGEQDWFEQRGVTNKDFCFLGWLDMHKIDYREVDKLPKS